MLDSFFDTMLVERRSDAELQPPTGEARWDWTNKILCAPAFDEVGTACHRAASPKNHTCNWLREIVIVFLAGCVFLEMHLGSVYLRKFHPCQSTAIDGVLILCLIHN